jgi:HEAT repeat protein/predicted Ser/Thr protein kinase
VSVLEQILPAELGRLRDDAMICPSCHDENHPAATVCFSCGKPMWMVTRGSLVGGRYEVLSVLGHGGMGVVYKAQDRTLDEPVALKVLRPQLAQTHQLATRFHSEIKLARKVRHPNVCAIHEYGEDGPHRYIAMEFIEGVTLRELVRQQGPLPPAEACAAALQVLYGLQAVHDLGIIHCDLKSANIMRDTQGVIRLMDFGLAKVRRADDSAATMTGTLEGTPEYMSPEQVLGNPVDFQSDLYALGIILFELLTGEVPFRGDTLVATMRMQLVGPPPLDGPRAVLLPAPIVPVLRRALAKEPSERYATARGMAKALRVIGTMTTLPETMDAPIRKDRIDVVYAADSVRRAEVLQALVLEMEMGDVPARCGAALTLGRMGPRARVTVPALVKALNDPHPHVAEAAASALRRIAATPTPAPGPLTPALSPVVGSPAVIDLIDMLRHEDASLRRIAVVALGEPRGTGQDAVPELVEVLQDQDEAVRREAARALGRIGGAAAVPSLVVALGDAPDDLVRVSAAEALGQIGRRATVAIPALIAALKHPDDGVCEAAARALVMIGLPAAPALIEAVTDDDGRLRLRAAAVLTEIVASGPPVAAAVAAVPVHAKKSNGHSRSNLTRAASRASLRPRTS